MRRAATILFALTPALAGMLGGCATTAAGRVSVKAPAAVVEPQPEWAGLATPADYARLTALPKLFAQARAAVPGTRAKLLAAETALVDPAAAQLAPELPPGPYHCRLVRFGGKARFTTFKPDFCYVETAQTAAGKSGMSFTKQTASQGGTLPEGWIYPDGERRQVFLGATKRKGDTTARRYGDDPGHDLAGVIERVSPFRWRLVLARAEAGATLDLYELVPVTPTVPGAKATVPGA